MTLKHIIQLIRALLLTTFIYGLILYIYLIATFSFAGETLSQKENREAIFFYTSAIIIATTIYVIYKQFKINQKFVAIGIVLQLMFAFYILFLTGQVYFNNISSHQTFDRSKWIKSEAKPFKMAKTVAKNKTLIGLTKRQVISKLGQTKNFLKNDKVDYLKYWTDKDAWELCLYFKGDKVVEAYLYQEGLGI
jgi:hypothetical protein